MPVKARGKVKGRNFVAMFLLVALVTVSITPVLASGHGCHGRHCRPPIDWCKIMPWLPKCQPDPEPEPEPEPIQPAAPKGWQKAGKANPWVLTAYDVVEVNLGAEYYGQPFVVTFDDGTPVSFCEGTVSEFNNAACIVTPEITGPVEFQLWVGESPVLVSTSWVQDDEVFLSMYGPYTTPRMDAVQQQYPVQ
jgi:hypothetical protein